MKATPEQPTTMRSLLWHVPKQAIAEELHRIGSNSNLLKSAFNSTEPVPLSTIINAPMADIIDYFAQLGDLSQARSIYDRYRYRGMKSLYLYECQGLKNSDKIDIGQFNQAIRATLEQHYPDGNRYARGLKAEDVVTISGDYPIEELAYSYIGYVGVVSPVTLCPQSVDDYRTGFVWMNYSEEWIAVCAKDDKINDILVRALQRYMGFTARRLQITKTALKTVEPDENLRRVTLEDQRTGTKRRFTNRRMKEDAEVFNEVKSRDQQDARPVSGYNEDIGDNDDTFALTYTCDQGKVYFSREMSVDEMRDWGPRKVQAIVDAVGNARSTHPEEALQLSIDAFKGLPAKSRDYVVEIAEGVYSCVTSHNFEVPLSSSVQQFIDALGTLIDIDVEAYCEECQETAELVCPTCGRRSLAVKNGVLTCSKCKEQVSLQETKCIDQHSVHIDSVFDAVTIIPRSLLIDAVFTSLESVTDDRYSRDEDFFWIRKGVLSFAKPTKRTIYSMDDIPELASLLLGNPPSDIELEIRSALAGFNEKCGRKPTKDDCRNCVQNTQPQKCLLRLFGMFDPDFIIKPHQGHEFGDYSKLVTLNAIPQQQLIIAMKRGNPDGHGITARDRIAQDVSSQVMVYRREAGVDVIGIGVPQQLDERLKNYIKLDAIASNKKILLLDDRDFVRISYAAMRRRGLGIDRI